MSGVLIVEDHASMRTTLRLMLSDLADSFTECNSGLGVCEAYEASHPDWVLMDIELPGKDGIAATRDLLTVNPAARVVMVTSFDDADLRQAAQEAGARGYFLKENLLELRQWLVEEFEPERLP